MSIILVKPKILNGAKKKELKDAGHIVIEIENSSDITVMDELGTANKDMVLVSALEALGWGNDPTCRNAFGNLFRKKLEEKLKINP